MVSESADVDTATLIPVPAVNVNVSLADSGVAVCTPSVKFAKVLNVASPTRAISFDVVASLIYHLSAVSSQ